MQIGGAMLVSSAATALGLGAGSADAAPPPHHHTNTAAEVKKLEQKLTKEQQELSRVSNIASRLIGVPKSELAGKNLRPVSELPGYSYEISRETRDSLLNSTLELLSRNKGDEGPFRPLCTATKVNYFGHVGVLTAGHCVNLEDNINAGQVDGWPAQNIFDSSSQEFAVSVAGDSYPIATATGLAYTPSGDLDFAFLPMQPDTKGSTPASSQFDELPSVDLSKAKGTPLPGEQVALFSDPQANNFHPVVETGRYLGVARANAVDESGKEFSAEVYVVGIDPSNAKSDSCNYGSSGSMAIGANGFFFGPLSWRQNVGYKSGDISQSIIDDPTVSEKDRITLLEAQLGIDLSQFSTICGYQIIRHSADPQKDTMTSLIQGLDHIAPYLPPQKGGGPSFSPGK